VARASQKPLALRFAGSLVEQLGAQLYPSATATVAELISNAWDADAKNVWVTIPFGESWTGDSEILALDDGHGMTREEAQTAYLIVGRKRRLEAGETSPGGRKVHGRKGIGKLAAFGTAGILECVTKRHGDLTAFALDYEEIRKLRPDQDYDVIDVPNPQPLKHPKTGRTLKSGTRIRLTRLWLKRALSEDQFIRSMSRRFSIDASEMRVFINGRQLKRFDMEVEFRFPRDGMPDSVMVDDDGWAVEAVDEEHVVRWWIGFTEKPLQDDTHQGISVLANKKMAQRPFKFERSQGTTGQLGQEYLVGEVEADWLDVGADIDQDLIQSNRDQLQLEDARLEAFLKWGRRRLTWALRLRNELRTKKVVDRYSASEELKTMLEPFTPSERRGLLKIAATTSQFPETTAEDVERIMRDVVNARSDTVVRQLMERIDEEEGPVQERMWALVHEFGLIDARRVLSLVEARLATIRRLKEALEAGAREVPELHRIVRDDAWLLDPRWHLMGDEVPLRELNIDWVSESDAETGDVLDFLFVLQPKPPAPIDEVVVVEIKRGTTSKGAVRRADESEVQKFHSYVVGVAAHYAANTHPPRVRGLMVAEGYTKRADPIRKSLEGIPDPKLEFKTWKRVLQETERMHLGWLEVSRERAAAD
jgi:hypothetical protein